MEAIESIPASEVQRLIDEMSKLKNAMKVGDFPCLERELQKRSFPLVTIRFVIGLCAIYWGRGEFDGMGFEFQDDLDVVAADKASCFSLSNLESYSVVEKHSGKLSGKWLKCMVREFSSEYAELEERFNAGPIVGEIELAQPLIRLDR